VNFGFLTDQDATRFCYLRLRRLKVAIKDPRILAALVEELEIPGDNAGDAGTRKTFAAIERRIEELRATETSLWYGVAAPEVLAASIFRAKRLANGPVQELFTHAPHERDLVGPITAWLKGGGLAPSQHISVGNARADFGGYRKGMMSGPRVVAVQMRNDLGELKRALDELVGLKPYTNATYLACTPAMAAAYLADFAAARGVHRWDPVALRRKLYASGSGLLLVEKDALAQALPAKERQLDAKTLDGLVAGMVRG
jgi:hypothetical protein